MGYTNNAFALSFLLGIYCTYHQKNVLKVCSEWRDIPPLYQSLSVEVSKNVTPACSLAMQPPPGVRRLTGVCMHVLYRYSAVWLAIADILVLCDRHAD